MTDLSLFCVTITTMMMMMTGSIPKTNKPTPALSYEVKKQNKQKRVKIYMLTSTVSQLY